MSALPLSKDMERRRFQRVKVSLLGRFMLPTHEEYPCQTRDISPGDVAIITPVPAKLGERIICYFDHIGRVEGKVTRTFVDGFALRFNATARKRDKLAAQLTWLANRDALNLPEDRRHERIEQGRRMSEITLPDGRRHKCQVIDISMSGAAVKLEARPPVGSPITLGRMRGRVVRHTEEGIGIEFSVVFSSADMVAERLFGDT
ncbi:MAG: PilZ domain-containing protein [Rhodobiaceae bacterium]|nr:PilZ domain-containing protein [Rhodobiaceae bacterium]